MTKSKLLLSTAAVVLLSANAANAGTLYISNLSGANENPPTTSTATGTGFVILNDAETSATVYATHNVGPTLSGGHIHRGGASINGPIILPFTVPTSPVGPLVWAIPAADVTNLKTLGLYMNFHTTTNPGGAIRGQLVRFRYTASALTDTQMAVANALDISAGFTSDLDGLLMSGATQTAATRAAELDDLSGRTLYAQTRQTLETMGSFEDSIFMHAEEDSAAPGAFAAFAKGGQSFGKRETSVDQAGAKTTRPFLMAGLAYGLMEKVNLGIAVGYADGEDEFRGGLGHTDVKTTSAHAYITSSSDILTLTVAGAYGWNKIDTTRVMSTISRTATSAHNGEAWSIGAKIFMPFHLQNGITVAPYGLVDSQHAMVKAYTETGAGSAGLVVPEHSDQDAAAEAGAAVSAPLGALFVARIQGGWRYALAPGRDYISTALAGSPAATFQTAILGPSNSAAHLAGSVSTDFNQQLYASVGYHGYISSRTSIHALEARLTLKF